jgi:hypothetical protein
MARKTFDTRWARNAVVRGGFRTPFSAQPKAIAPTIGGTIKGSSLRGGNSIIAVGGQGSAVVVDGDPWVDAYSIQEEAVLDRLLATQGSNAATGPNVVTDIVHNNNSLITGSVPSAMFAPDCLYSPPFGGYVSPQSKLRVEGVNNSGITRDFFSSFNSKAVTPGTYRENYNVFGQRNLMAIGGPGVTTVPAGDVVTSTYSIEEEGVGGRFIADTFDTGDLITVESIRYDNVELLSGVTGLNMFRKDSVMSPLLAILFQESHSLKVTFRNHGASPILVAHGFTVL